MAHENIANAKKFFKRMAQKWGAYDNVIFDIYNEPVCVKNGNVDCNMNVNGGRFVNWPELKAYADQIVEVIRKYSDNLIIMGTPEWSQKPHLVKGAPVADPAGNTAYAFHYYAGSHDLLRVGRSAMRAMKYGLSVFVSEWGTINAVVKGKIVESNEQWQKWMNDHKLSSANWSLTNWVEDTEKKYGGDGQGGSYFAADFDPAKPDAEWKYSESGAWVNEHVFADLPKSYTKCKLLPAKK
jgi:hypothetical protein